MFILVKSADHTQLVNTAQIKFITKTEVGSTVYLIGGDKIVLEDNGNYPPSFEQLTLSLGVHTNPPTHFPFR